jgi:hypothetical protein
MLDNGVDAMFLSDYGTLLQTHVFWIDSDLDNDAGIPCMEL